MKLIYLANTRMPTERAYGIQISKMCEAFAEQGVDVELLVPRRNNLIKESPFDYYRVKNNFKFSVLSTPDFYFWSELNRISVPIKSFISAVILCFKILKHKPDLIYSRDELPIFLLTFFVKPSKLIFEVHKFSKWRKPIHWLFGKVGIKFVVISHGLEKEFLELGVQAKKMIYASDGIDLMEFDIDITQEEARSRSDLTTDKKIVMYTGHLFDWKGAHILAKAAHFLPDVWFIFVGGTDADILKFKDKYGQEVNIKILGQKPHAEIPVFLKAADVLVLPNVAGEAISRLYTSPLKLFEYMASSRPIVASDLPSIREVLNDKNSFLVPSDNPEQIAQSIKIALSNSTDSATRAQNALEDVRNYSWDKRAEKIIKFINNP